MVQEVAGPWHILALSLFRRIGRRTRAVRAGVWESKTPRPTGSLFLPHIGPRLVSQSWPDQTTGGYLEWSQTRGIPRAQKAPLGPHLT